MNRRGAVSNKNVFMIPSFVKKRTKKSTRIEAPSVRKVPQLYSPKASYIALQLYYATHRDIVLRAVLMANIISRKPIGFHITL